MAEDALDHALRRAFDEVYRAGQAPSKERTEAWHMAEAYGRALVIRAVEERIAEAVEKAVSAGHAGHQA